MKVKTTLLILLIYAEFVRGSDWTGYIEAFSDAVKASATKYATRAYEDFSEDPGAFLGTAAEIVKSVTSECPNEQNKGISQATDILHNAGVSIVGDMAKQTLTDYMKSLEYASKWDGLIVRKQDLQPGDMIFAARLGGLYRHYGIYIGYDGSGTEWVFDFSRTRRKVVRGRDGQRRTSGGDEREPFARKRELSTFLKDCEHIYLEPKGTMWTVENAPIPPEESKQLDNLQWETAKQKIADLESMSPFGGVPKEELNLKNAENFPQKYDLIDNNCEHLSRWIVGDVVKINGKLVPRSFQGEFLEAVLPVFGMDVEECKKILTSVGTY